MSGPAPRVPTSRLAALRARGLTFAEINQRCGYKPYDAGTAFKRLVAAGLHKPKVCRRTRPGEREEALRLCAAGMPNAEVARRVGVNRHLVHNWRVDAGIPPPPPRRLAAADAPCRDGCGRTRSDSTLRCDACDRAAARNGECRRCGRALLASGCRACDGAKPRTSPVKFTTADRRRALAFVRRGALCYAEIARRVGCNEQTLRAWRRKGGVG